MSQENKVKLIKLLDFVTLEAREADTQAVSNRVIVNTFYSDQLNLVCKYTTGAGETNNNAYIKVWGYIGTYDEHNTFPYGSSINSNITDDSDNWIQYGTFDTLSGVSTFTANTFKIVGAAASTTYDAHFALGITFPKIRISAYEDGVVSKKGRLSVVALIQ